MGKLTISQELSDKISKSLNIKKSDIVDSHVSKPIIRDSPKKKEPVKHSPEPERTPDPPKINSPKKNPTEHTHTKKIFYKPIKSNKPDKPDKLDKINYIKITKIVFISSIVGGIGITLGIKLGSILFL